jgi:hypothetical protein
MSATVNITYEKEFNASVHVFDDDVLRDKVKSMVNAMKIMTKPPKQSSQSIVTDKRGTKYVITFKP